MVDAREKLHIPWGDPDNQKHGNNVMAFDTRSAMMARGQLGTSVFLQYLPSIKALWADSGIQNAYDRRREFQLVRTCSYTHTVNILLRNFRTTVRKESEKLPALDSHTLSVEPLDM